MAILKETNRYELESAIDEITAIADGFGLDFYPMRYELCPAEVIYTFGAYGMPTRFSHWSFGKQFYKMKLQYDLGLSKIYELVINSDPCYAFLLNTNSLIQNKMIVAHVLAHCDFFKNNVRFRHTRRDMVESMSRTAERISAYENEYGREKVESFISAVLSIQEHIDPYLLDYRSQWMEKEEEEKNKKEETPSINKGNYEDLLDRSDRQHHHETRQGPARSLEEKDLMFYIQEHSHILEPWQRDIMTMLREEMLYFWPQLETKIMNEGWATYWHAKIMRQLDLTTDESVEFAKLHANVTQPSQKQLNPYYLGLKLLEYIEQEELKENGENNNEALQKLFDIRALDSDQSFIRNYMTKDFVQKEDLFLFHKKENDYVIQTKDWEAVRDELVASRVNGGFPYLIVTDGDYLKNGELYIKHRFEGIELDVPYLEKVLLHIHELWGRTVHLESTVENYPVLFSCDGQKVHRKRVH